MENKTLKPGRLARWGLAAALVAGSIGCTTKYDEQKLMTLGSSGSADGVALVDRANTRESTQLPSNLPELTEERKAELDSRYAGLPSQVLNIYIAPSNSDGVNIENNGPVELIPIRYDSTGPRNGTARIYDRLEGIIADSSMDFSLVQATGYSPNDVSERTEKHRISSDTTYVLNAGVFSQQGDRKLLMGTGHLRDVDWEDWRHTENIDTQIYFGQPTLNLCKKLDDRLALIVGIENVVMAGGATAEVGGVGAIGQGLWEIGDEIWGFCEAQTPPSGTYTQDDTRYLGSAQGRQMRIENLFEEAQESGADSITLLPQNYTLSTPEGDVQQQYVGYVLTEGDVSVYVDRNSIIVEGETKRAHHLKDLLRRAFFQATRRVPAISNSSSSSTSTSTQDGSGSGSPGAGSP
jgi:hypothetical protein